ncbi:DASH family cryptochrome [Polynucleobacter antarcticus]|uniref:Cryptochrome DASH n=1 Tax=Polynucleobacter antarcticus TaxID=1743162 RepID=A0A6M9PLP4_9BURK|nr:DASH family cryptochrome [Polynucleobacter antarcticus]QKM63154.1 DASH family cryptochrome [Polynucleobacter antarcticus]
MTVLIYWFRNDLRLRDNPGLAKACLAADYLLPIYLHQPEEVSHPLGFMRMGAHRKRFLKESLEDLRTQLNQMGSDLFEYTGHPSEVIPGLMQATGAQVIYCEHIEAPEEMDQVSSLQSVGIEVHEFWQSSMLDPIDLPFDLPQMPDVFSSFRRAVEKAELRYAKPVKAPKVIPPIPPIPLVPQQSNEVDSSQRTNDIHHHYRGGETSAYAHFQQYLKRRLPDTYKETRNQLIGLDYSSKCSLGLASGCLSARVIASEIDSYEQHHGANDGTYWLWFELLWRDYFRFIHFKYGKKLYSASGLSELPLQALNAKKFKFWSAGNTGEPLVDAGMRELLASGYLSNRMRQIVASYWVYDMQGDWQAGAAWFESQLIDYDVYSNQGNWLYLAGRGTDPRGGRRFNIAKQTQDHDPEGAYRDLWL